MLTDSAKKSRHYFTAYITQTIRNTNNVTAYASIIATMSAEAKNLNGGIAKALLHFQCGKQLTIWSITMNICEHLNRQVVSVSTAGALIYVYNVAVRWFCSCIIFACTDQLYCSLQETKVIILIIWLKIARAQREGGEGGKYGHSGQYKRGCTKVCRLRRRAAALSWCCRYKIWDSV